MFLLMIFISVLLSLSVVQTKIANFATHKINQKYGTEIDVAKVDLSSFRHIKLYDVLIKDHHHDTLIYVNKIKTSILNYQDLLNSNLKFGDIELQHGALKMKTYKDESINNLTVFSNKFQTDTVPSEKPFQLTSKNILVDDIDFELYNENKQIEAIVYYHQISGNVEDFSIYKSDIKGDIYNLKFKENHKLEVKQMDTKFFYSNTKMEFFDTRLQTERSDIKADIEFNYQKGDLSQFTDKVHIDAKFIESEIALSDLKKFYKEFGVNDKLFLEGHAQGTINDFKMNEVVMTSNRSSGFTGSFTLKNALHKEKFYLNAKILQLTSNYDHLKNLLPNLLGNKIPSTARKFGNFTSKGNVVVSHKDILADLVINSEIGKAKTDIQIFNIDHIDNASYKGQLELEDLELGLLLNDSLIGQFSLIGGVEGQGFKVDNLNTRVDGVVLKHQYKGYTYENIEVSGVIKEKHFNGYLGIQEPNIQLEFKGLADLSDKNNYHFDFNADVEYINFYELNLFKRDSTAIAKGIIDINFHGSNLDNIIGDLNFEKATYINDKDIYYFEDFSIASTIENDIRELTINSPDIISGFMKGNFKFKELPKVTKNALGSLFINYQKEAVSPGQYITFNFNIYNKIIDAIFPDISIGSNTFIRGEMVSDEDKFEVTVKSPEIIAFNNQLDNIRLQIDNKNEIYNTLLSVDHLDTKMYDLHDINLVNVTLNDTLLIKTDFYGGEDKKEHYDLSFYHTINNNNQSVFGIKKSEFTVKDNVWQINPKNNNLNKIVFDNSLETFAIDKISFKSGYQFIDLAGVINNEKNKHIDLKLENVNLNAITPTIDSVYLGGKVNGTFSIKEIQGKMLPFANVRINYFNVNQDYYGDLSFTAQADDKENHYGFDATILNADLKSFQAKGTVDFTTKTPQLDANVLFDKFKIKAFSPLGKNVISNLRGLASGSANFAGPLENPSINGEIDLLDAGLKVPYLNVNYDFVGNTPVKLRDNVFDFETIQIEDVDMKTRGTLSGTISHNKFKAWFLDLSLSSNRLLVLNTQESEEALYYGTGLLAGNTTLKGPTDNLTIDVQGRTLKGTEFIIPLNYVSNVNTSRLIHFENPNDLFDDSEISGDVIFENLKGLNINFNLDVTKDAVAEIVIDKVTGSLLRGSGDGNIRMSIDTNGKFEMYGSLLIDNGEYQFKNLVNKDFEVKRGGTIVWNGSPYDAILSIEAIHHAKANPSVLLTEISSSRKIDVELITYITGSLSNANFNFDIKIPNADSTVSSELEFKLNKEDDRLTQFFSVLATGTFMNLDQKNNANFNGNAAIAGTLAEKASSFLSQMLKSDNDNLQLGVSYDAAVSNSVENVITDDQVGISVSGRILDKVTVSGKVGVPVGANANSKVIGEVEVSVPLNKSETLQGKVYNRQNEIQFDVIDSEGYTQGAGISYRFEFDNTNEFLRKIGFKKTKKEKEAIQKKKDSIKLAKKEEKKQVQ